jgi:hypothetical protein
MVGRLTLAQEIGVRVPVSQPFLPSKPTFIKSEVGLFFANKF